MERLVACLVRTLGGQYNLFRRFSRGSPAGSRLTRPQYWDSTEEGVYNDLFALYFQPQLPPYVVFRAFDDVINHFRLREKQVCEAPNFFEREMDRLLPGEYRKELEPLDYCKGNQTLRNLNIIAKLALTHADGGGLARQPVFTKTFIEKSSNRLSYGQYQAILLLVAKFRFTLRAKARIYQLHGHRRDFLRTVQSAVCSGIVTIPHQMVSITDGPGEHVIPSFGGGFPSDADELLYRWSAHWKAFSSTRMAYTEKYVERMRFYTMLSGFDSLCTCVLNATRRVNSQQTRSSTMQDCIFASLFLPSPLPAVSESEEEAQSQLVDHCDGDNGGWECIANSPDKWDDDILTNMIM